MRRLRRLKAISRNFYIRARVRDLLDLPLNLRNLRRLRFPKNAERFALRGHRTAKEHSGTSALETDAFCP